jgi:type IV fimbrial biogenesis protein FimT
MTGQPTRGFTLIEAIICLAIGSLVLVLAIPVCTSALARADASAARSALLASLTEAIHHSALTGTEVVLCPGDQLGCRDTFDWTGGWIVYADLDGNGKRDPGDTLLDLKPCLSDRVRLLTSTGRRRLVFQPNGGNSGSNVTFTLCYRTGHSRAQSLVLANNGRLRATTASPSRTRMCDARGI